MCRLTCLVLNFIVQLSNKILGLNLAPFSKKLRTTAVVY